MFYVVFCIVHSVNYEGHSRINNKESISQKVLLDLVLFEPRHEKTGFLQMRNKHADQLRGNREADQHLCFRNTASTIPPLPKSEISSLLPFSVVVQPGLCRTLSETPKIGFLRTRLICNATRGNIYYLLMLVSWLYSML